ncbi:hypothetical protein [Pseudonocardia charpentierae]|uniref:Uncharacterized protein n=1 Tax=Pseudonocardia charpentierae TaxID=3075545 RepID=A0ABU2N6G8_9PSEU|nr:hypothetical protein [Pseudonocardia sp. DSM 45834]MDT0349537.1 hypothetical protein [Pseudonocardia sp. DSM 45834]
MSSHRALAHDVSRIRPPSAYAPSGRFDAIIVPAARGAAALNGAAHLSARLGVPLVALCSKDTRAVEAAARVAHVRGCRALVVDVPTTYRHDWLPARTTAPRLRGANAHRRSDTSLKRNLGLLMARLYGWGKILFLDDDIGDSIDGTPVSVPPPIVRRLAAELDVSQIAGLTCREFPDNSVVCHARRLAGYRQDTFVSGAALAVNCNDQPVPFFPDIYNEDWFFFSPLVAERRLGLAGTATQAPYDPFADPQRAREEEFGDLLAEGLYTLFEKQAPEIDYFERLDAADERYWQWYIEARRETLALTSLSLESAVEYAHDADRCAAALHSLDAAIGQLDRLSALICADYVAAWAGDLREWEWSTQRVRSVAATTDVMRELDLPTWDVIGRSDYSRGQVFIGTAA